MGKHKSKYVYIVYDEDGNSIGYTYSKKAAKRYLKFNSDDTVIRVENDGIDILGCMPLQEYTTPEGRLYVLTEQQADWMHEAFSSHMTQLVSSITSIIESLPAIKYGDEDLGKLYGTLSFLNDLKFDISIDQYPYMNIFDDSLLAEFYSLRILGEMSHEEYVSKKMDDLKGAKNEY